VGSFQGVGFVSAHIAVFTEVGEAISEGAATAGLRATSFHVLFSERSRRRRVFRLKSRSDRARRGRRPTKRARGAFSAARRIVVNLKGAPE
jgi:hypothetical protein